MAYWLNGEFKDNVIGVNIADRGFLLGDGLFETLAVVEGAPVFLGEHMERLCAGLKTLGVNAMLGDEEAARVIQMLAERNNVHKGLACARITVTRGAGARGLVVDETVKATVLATVDAYAPPQTSAPATLVISGQRRNEHGVAARWKTLNYLDNILARREASGAGADDAVMLNIAGRVACASAANIFTVRDGIVKTPPISEGALPGIVRAILLRRMRKAGIPVKVAPITVDDLGSSALILTNSLIGVRAARIGVEFDDDALKILHSLQSCYADAMAENLSKQALS